jgi:pimeloyl-ACP methyl ester carboxylesterase
VWKIGASSFSCFRRAFWSPLLLLWLIFMAAKALAFDVFGPKTAAKTAVFLHGILGHKRNWRTPAMLWTKMHPDTRCITIDHRGHGTSGSGTPPHTITNCALDVKELLDAENLPAPDIMVGHSFGGKVALKYLENCEIEGQNTPAQTWILDSIPFLYPKELDIEQGENSVYKVFEVLDKLPESYVSREWFVDELSKEVPRPIALWLATNVNVQSDRKTFKLGVDIGVVKQLFSNFCELDLSDLLNNYRGSGHVHFVRAGRNKLWETGGGLEKLKKMESNNDKIHVHTMPNVGHWLHTEDLDGLFKLMRKYS